MAPARKKLRLSEGEASTSLHKGQPNGATENGSTDGDIITNTDNSKPQPSRSLFVRALASSVTSESLAALFSDSYPIKHAVAVTDATTKECRGYGFVTFADAEDAERAKQELNGTLFEGKKIKIEIAERRDREEKSGARAEAKAQRELDRAQERQAPRLIVRNLPWTIKNSEQLASLFNSYGKVKEAYIPKRSGGLLPGFGFVVMRSKKHAEKAIEGENGKEVDGRTIAVDWAVKKEVYQQLQIHTPLDDAEPTEEFDLQEELEDAQQVEDEMDVDEEEEEEEDEADGSEDDSDGEAELDDDDSLSAREANTLEDRSATLFVRNLPFTCTDEDLEDHFAAFGSIRYARIVIDAATERPKGTGFVAFRSREDADACLRAAPSKIAPLQQANDGKHDRSQVKTTSILQNTEADPTGKYTLDGRILQLSKAVDKTEANRLTQEGVNHRYKRDKDKRRLYLLSEGTIPSNSKLWESLPPSEKTMREASLKQRKTLIENNPSLHFSLTRLAVRNIPRSVGSKELKALAREAIVGFAKDVKDGKRHRISEEELGRGGEEMKAAERARREAGKGVVKQAKVVFESEGGSKVEESSGAGRSRGYGFIEYHTHRNALMGLRWLNGHSIGYQVHDPEAKKDRNALQDRKKRLIVEFAIENAQVVHRRADREQKAKDRSKLQQDAKDETTSGTASQKRKRGDKRSGTGSAATEQRAKLAVDEKVAQRNRIIGRKRAMRREKRNRK